MNANEHEQTLHGAFLSTAEQFPDGEALRVQGQSYSYEDLRTRAAQISATLQQNDPEGGALTAVLARRSVTTYAGMLAALMRGTGYLALNPKHPRERLQAVLKRVEITSILLDESGEALLPELVTETPRVWVMPHRTDVTDYRNRWPAQKFIGAEELVSAEQWVPTDTAQEDIAYVLFTSGSSGAPKGVVVEHRNAMHFVRSLCALYEVTREDTISQFPEITFDGSVLDIWCAWYSGATLCVPSDMDIMKTHEFIIREEVTIWVFVPSLSLTMERLGLLKPGIFPKLRIWGFGSEAVPVRLAEACQRSAPNAVIDNQYGPTEATVACSLYRWTSEQADVCRDGMLPIGQPLPGNDCRILDHEFHDVSPGTPGELWIGGPQVARGYWDDPDRTEEVFRLLPGSQGRFYRTGDRVVFDQEHGVLHFLGRTDTQIQIRGHRVELREVELALRTASGVSKVLVFGWPSDRPGAADGLVAFLEGDKIDIDSVRTDLASKLPDYMLPRKILCISSFPLNANGKIDRKALVEAYAERLP